MSLEKTKSDIINRIQSIETKNWESEWWWECLDNCKCYYCQSTYDWIEEPHYTYTDKKITLEYMKWGSKWDNKITYAVEVDIESSWDTQTRRIKKIQKILGEL
jgi:hypothetical protein